MLVTINRSTGRRGELLTAGKLELIVGVETNNGVYKTYNKTCNKIATRRRTRRLAEI